MRPLLVFSLLSVCTALALTFSSTAHGRGDDLLFDDCYGYRYQCRPLYSRRFFQLLAGVGAVGLIYYAFGRIGNANRIRRAVQDFKRAYSLDPSWDIKLINQTVRQTFHLYQQAWMAGDLKPVESLMHPDYYQQAVRNLETSLGRGLINVIKEPQILSWDLLWVRDVPGQDGDSIIVELRASMINYTINESTGWFVDSPLLQEEAEARELWIQRAMREPQPFTEFWAFMRVDGRWLLFTIQQSEVLLQPLMNATDQTLREILIRARNHRSSVPMKKTV